MPACIQNQIISAYAGPIKVFSMPDADHDTPLTESDLEQLRSLASWLVQPSKGKLVPRVPRVGVQPVVRKYVEEKTQENQ